MTKRLATGEPSAKHFKPGYDQPPTETVPLAPSVTRHRPILTPETKRANSSYLNVAGEFEEDFPSPRRHQLAMLTIHSEPIHALLDFGAIPGILSD